MHREAVILETREQLDQFISHRGYSSIFILVDEHTHTHCLSSLQNSCLSLRDVEIIEVEPGEQSKDIAIAAQLWEALIQLGADRNSCLLNLGGGVITDLGGFIASTLKRGMPFIHVPTSLLAMVDAAIGGKTGINIAGIKNQAGTFAEPEAILVDSSWLRSLPNRESLSGFSEMLKHAIISADGRPEAMLEIDPHTFIRDTPGSTLQALVRDSAHLKEVVVRQDREEQNLRKALNFGHTTGHALEAVAATTKNPLTHGEAVALGMIVALELSKATCELDPGFCTQVQNYLLQHYPGFPEIDAAALWPYMLADKKNKDGEVRFVLLAAPGRPVIDAVVDKETFSTAYDASKNLLT